MLRLWPPDFDHGRHSDAPHKASVDGVLSSGRSATPGVTEGARYSFSPSRLCPLETEQKAGVRNGKPDFLLRNQCCRRGCTSRRNPPGPCESRKETDNFLLGRLEHDNVFQKDQE